MSKTASDLQMSVDVRGGQNSALGHRARVSGIGKTADQARFCEDNEMVTNVHGAMDIQLFTEIARTSTDIDGQASDQRFVRSWTRTDIDGHFVRPGGVSIDTPDSVDMDDGSAPLRVGRGRPQPRCDRPTRTGAPCRRTGRCPFHPRRLRLTIGRPRGITKIHASKTACLRGHPFTPANTYRYTDAGGHIHRQCRACERLRRQGSV
jgi:hypothetical protein